MHMFAVVRSAIVAAAMISMGTASARCDGDSQPLPQLPQPTRPAGSVSVVDHGAVGDGVADDTAAIQAALRSGAVRIYFPRGTYRITAELALSSGQVVVGDGADASIVRQTTAGANGFQLRDVSWTELRDVAVVGPGASTGWGILFRGGGNNRATGVRTEGFANGVHILSASTVRLGDVYVSGALDAGIRITSSGGVPTVGLELRNVRVVGSSGAGILVDGVVSGLLGDAVSVESNSGAGLRVERSEEGEPSQLWFSKLIADSNGTDGIALMGGNMMYFTDPWASNRGSGKNFVIAAAVADVQVTAGRIYNCTGNGIEIAGDRVALLGTSIEHVGVNGTGAFDGVYVTGSRVDLIGVRATGGNTRWGATFAAGATNYRVIGGVLSGSAGSGPNDVATRATAVLGFTQNYLGGVGIDGAGLHPSTEWGVPQPGAVYQGGGAPGDASGKPGDLYFRTDAPTVQGQRIYVKTPEGWRGIL